MHNYYFPFLFTAFLLGTAKGAVHFKNSLILDEFDLSGKDSVSLDSVCTANGCKVYVSSLKDATFIDKLAFKAGNAAEVSLKSYAYDFDNDTMQKVPFLVKKGDSISIKNSNENLAVGPIVVYAVSASAPNFDIAGVYDVAQKYRQEQASGKVVTVMSPKPFTVWASSPNEKLEASVLTAGFDVEDADKCAEVYHSTRGLGIKYAVNGPISTLFFVDEVEMNVDFLDFFETNLDLTSATFFSSPGYIGCANAEVYHSSLYNSAVNFVASSDVARSTLLEALLNTEDPLTLRLDENPEMERNFTGSIADDSYSRSGEITARELSFSFCMADPDASFLVKFTDLGISTITSRRTLPPTSPTPTPCPTSPTSVPPTSTSTTAKPTTSGAKGTSMALGLVILLSAVLGLS